MTDLITVNTCLRITNHGDCTGGKQCRFENLFFDLVLKGQWKVTPHGLWHTSVDSIDRLVPQHPVEAHDIHDMAQYFITTDDLTSGDTSENDFEWHSQIHVHHTKKGDCVHFTPYIEQGDRQFIIPYAHGEDIVLLAFGSIPSVYDQESQTLDELWEYYENIARDEYETSSEIRKHTQELLMEHVNAFCNGICDKKTIMYKTIQDLITKLYF